MIYTICSNCGEEIPKGTTCKCKKYYRYNKNNIKYTKFYTTPEWKRMRDYITKYYTGMCLVCLMKRKEIVMANVVHHIEELRDNWDRRLDKDNLIPVCHKCHNGEIRKAYENEGTRRALQNELFSYLKQYKEIYK